MEVNPQAEDTDKAFMRDYWDKFRKRTYVIITSAQCTVVLVGIGLMELFGVTHLGWFGLFIFAFIAAAVLNAVTISLVHLIGRPFHDLVSAIVLVSGEPNALMPPNPNENQYDRDGFKQILQTVYELASRNQAPLTTAEEAEPSEGVAQNPTSSILSNGIDETSTGFAILDENLNVLYHNKSAPVRVNTKSKEELELIFTDPTDDLASWLQNNRKNKLTDEHQWTRVADKLPGENGRRIFDITASFRKDSPAETVVTLFDRTNTYMPEEDDLDFISFAAHELRGPITVIRGYLDVLQDELEPVLQQDQAELMQRLTVTSNRLTSYVNNILNASKYDRRHMSLRLTEDSIRHIYEQIADDMQLRASSQRRVLVTDIPDNLPTVAADPNSIGEVMGNLIDNAIKYSNEGGLVHVTARTVSGFVEVSVIDRGIGMPANVLPNLFHKFYRSHRSRETVAGTGIGLYICKAIVSSHGGTITARSIENEGSTFTFTLPIYDTVADKLKADHNSNISLIEHGSGWIRNHSLYRS